MQLIIIIYFIFNFEFKIILDLVENILKSNADFGVYLKRLESYEAIIKSKYLKSAIVSKIVSFLASANILFVET
ncbi:hypothetical protein BpHYR1_035062 [Brachionus plicatilis]|uniref:Uncharacterized protein n=1 Tax=Brachionus plicatilis TaxID=10195 RepID=A0A3M7SZ75_BRAPC|nr:hypothetical protein BpHYR1_035062 [Brachionus plicatilis]